MKAFIKAISYYLPSHTLDNAEINLLFPEWSVDKISEKTGIMKRPISAPEEFSSDMGITASEKLFSEHGIDRNDIDFILFCTQSPDYFLPTTACLSSRPNPRSHHWSRAQQAQSARCDRVNPVPRALLPRYFRPH